MSEGLRIRLALPRARFALRVDLALPPRGITVVYGASGSGKTSLLRCVAGLERAPDGELRFGADTWQDARAGVFVPTWRRPLGYVFQEASLFAHLDVLGNLRYGLGRLRGRSDARATDARALDDAIDLLGLGELLHRPVDRLSGGERQRVAIARALARRPRLLLLDEPLASIDQARRREILPWLERIRDELGVPMLHVTHSPDELARLADHLVVLERGTVRASGPVAEVLASVASPAFDGDEAGALLHGEVVERDARWHLARIGFDGGGLWLRDAGLAVGTRVRLRVLARDVSLATEEPRGTSILNHLACTVESIADDAHPSQALLRVRVGATPLLARITRRSVDALGLRAGARAWVQVKAAALVQ